MTPRLRVRDLRTADGVLAGVDLEVAAGELSRIQGPTGIGKTTFVSALFGERAATGEVTLDGRALRGLPPEARARRGLRVLPQVDGLFLAQSVRANLTLGAWTLPAARREAAVDALLERFGALGARRDQPAEVLSGGERRLLAFAQALIAEPAVLVLDEPAAGLSPAAVALMTETVEDLRARGSAVLVLEQPPGLMAGRSSATATFSAGRLVPLDATPPPTAGPRAGSGGPA